jgi:hypothetical protein
VPYGATLTLTSLWRCDDDASAGNAITPDSAAPSPSSAPPGTIHANARRILDLLKTSLLMASFPWIADR